MPVNRPLLDKVLGYIEANNDLWNQNVWAEVNINGFDGDTLKRMILDDPENPACGTAMCFAGHACNLSGWRPFFRPVTTWGGELDGKSNEYMLDSSIHSDVCRNKAGEVASVKQKATELLGINLSDADALFDGNNDLDELREMAAHLKEHGHLGEYTRIEDRDTEADQDDDYCSVCGGSCTG
jgi:hypothetical protein